MRSLISTAILSTVLAGTAAADTKFDLEFEGGTASEYAEAVARAAGSINVVVDEDSRHFPLQALTLRNVDTTSALSLLDDREIQVADHTYQLAIEELTRTIADSTPVYRVVATRRTTQRGRTQGSMRPPQQSYVWSLDGPVSAGHTTDSTLAAIETSLDLFGDTFEAPTLRFHTETMLLIVRAAPAQIDAIGDVIATLERSPAASTRTEAADENRLALIRSQEQVGTLEAAIAALQEQLAALKIAMIESDTRMNLFKEESARSREQAQHWREAAMTAEAKLRLYDSSRGDG